MMNTDAYFQQIMKANERADSVIAWMIGIGVIMGLIQLGIGLFFMMKMTKLMDAAVQFLNVKSTLIAAQLEGKRFVDERTPSVKPSLDADDKYRPKM